MPEAIWLASAAISVYSSSKQAGAARDAADAELRGIILSNEVKASMYDDLLAEDVRAIDEISGLQNQWTNDIHAAQTAGISAITAKAREYDETISKNLRVSTAAYNAAVDAQLELDQLRNYDEKVRAVREARIARATAVALGHNQGAGFSTGVLGGVSSVGSQLHYNINFLRQADEIQKTITRYNKASALFSTNAQIKEMEKSTTISGMTNQLTADISYMQALASNDMWVAEAWYEYNLKDISYGAQKEIDEIAADTGADIADANADGAVWGVIGDAAGKVGSTFGKPPTLKSTPSGGSSTPTTNPRTGYPSGTGPGDF